MTFPYWYLLVGLLLIGIAMSGSVVKRLPLTTALIYLAIGVVLGPVTGVLRVEPIAHAKLIEHLSELGVILSLFTAGLKLRVPLRDRRWLLPLRLAFGSMALTVAIIAAAGVWLLDLPIGAAVLLGAILAPTDPVLASDVQVAHPGDRDRLRFGLTGEAGLNDGTAFPFVMLGLGLMGLHNLGHLGARWVAIDVVWAVAGGLAIGGFLGTLVGRLVLYLRRTRREAAGLDEFLSLGLLALAYGGAMTLYTYGFLAAFAAGVALRRIEAQLSKDDPSPPMKASSSRAPAGEKDVGAPPAEREAAGGNAELSPPPELAAAAAAAETRAVERDKVPAYMAQAVLAFNEQIERLAEVLLVLLVGALLSTEYVPREALWFVPLLLLVIRPAAVLIGVIGSPATTVQRRLFCWFGIRGIGSLYYLAYAITHGAGRDEPDALRLLCGLTFTTIAASVVLHGISVTPLMELYGRLRGRRSAPRP